MVVQRLALSPQSKKVLGSHLCVGLQRIVTAVCEIVMKFSTQDLCAWAHIFNYSHDSQHKLTRRKVCARVYGTFSVVTVSQTYFLST